MANEKKTGKAGYEVVRYADGCGAEYAGHANNLREARDLVARAEQGERSPLFQLIAAVWRMKGRNPEEVDTLTIVARILRDFALLYPSGPLTVREGRARELHREDGKGCRPGAVPDQDLRQVGGGQ